MTVQQPMSYAHALAACALFQTFDRAALLGILDIDAGMAAEIVRRQEVEQIASDAELYRLRPADAQTLLDRLRAEHASDELHLHTRAFQYYLRWLEQPMPVAQRLPYEQECMHHLRALYDLLLEHLRRDEAAAFVASFRAAVPQPQPHHQAQLALFDAYSAMRHQEYQLSAAAIDQLLQDPDLSPRVRGEAFIIRGLAAWSQAQLEDALADFGRGRALGAAAGDHLTQGLALIDQSCVYNQLIQFERALDLARQSLAHFRQAHDIYNEAFALYCIGNNALYLGHWDDGLAHLDQAAAIYDRAGMSARLAMVEWARGLLNQLLGDEPASEQAYLRTLAVATSAQHYDSVIAVDTLTQLGLLYYTQARWSDAQSAIERAIGLAEELGDNHRRALLLHRYALLQDQQGDSGVARRILADAITGIESLRSSTQSEEIKIDLLGTVQQAYESAVLAHVDSHDNASAFAYVERARARAFLDLLARRDEELAAQLAQQPVSLADVQAHLDPGTLLLEYFTIGAQAAGNLLLDRIPDTNVRLREQLSAPPEILLFAITSDHLELHRIKFNPNRLQPHPDDPMPGRHLLGDRRLARLYQLLIQPVEHLIAGRRLLYIIPHGPLHYLSFAALQAPNGTTLLSPGGPALAYAPSATVLQACLARPAERGTAHLALGYNSAGDRALRFAEHEAQQIALMLGGTALHGPAPKSVELLELAPRLRQLHIGGHAVFRQDDPLGSYVLLGLDDQIDARSLIRDLKLSADLVTLNACTSGLSSVVPGDELLGLPRALLSAGAATVVCTLAEVDDLAAYLLMIMFYRNLALGRTPASALHAAQNSLRALTRAEVEVIFEEERANGAQIELPPLERYGEQPFADPAHWAPFLLIGRP